MTFNSSVWEKHCHRCEVTRQSSDKCRVPSVWDVKLGQSMRENVEQNVLDFQKGSVLKTLFCTTMGRGRPWHRQCQLGIYTTVSPHGLGLIRVPGNSNTPLVFLPLVFFLSHLQIIKIVSHTLLKNIPWLPVLTVESRMLITDPPLEPFLSVTQSQARCREEELSIKKLSWRLVHEW